MAIIKALKKEQGYGAFNGGEIIENKPIGFPQDGGRFRAFSNIFYWANAKALVDSTIGLHPHKGFEIISFVLEGSIRHFDTKMKVWKELQAGDVQIIRSGNGISHAEHMNKDSRMFQVWLDPNLSESLQKEASYSDYNSEVFPEKQINNNTELTYIGENSPFKLDTADIVCKRITIREAAQLEAKENRILSVYILTDGLESDSIPLEKDSFLRIENEVLELKGEGEIFYFDSPVLPTYKTYASQMI